jgi:glycosyltransferase involved in cell wall biosynthesis
MLSSTIRAAHVIHSLEPGGAESVLVGLTEAAPSAGLEIAVMPLIHPRDERHVRALRSRGVAVLEPNLRSRWDPRAFPRAVHLLRAWNPDVIHTHLKHADIVGAVAARVLHRPLVSTLHIVDDARDPLARLKRRLAGVGRLATASMTVAVSEAQRLWYLEAFPTADPGKVVTIHNGVVDSGRTLREEVRRELGVPPGTVVLVQIGILRDGKGHHDLFAAARELEDLPDLEVWIVGDGPLRGELEAAAGRRVRFLGFRDDVDALLAAADVVVQPSHYDALPTTVIQGLAAGRPIVATAVGGIPEIVTAECGVLVPPGAPGALAAAVRVLATSPERRTTLGAAARARFEQTFQIDHWAARLATLYRTVGPAGAEGAR